MIGKALRKWESQAPEETGDGARIALDEDDLYGREEPKEESLQFIVFRVAREWYGVDITKVKEVIKTDRITYLPSSPEHIAGIVNLRGNILSVMDLRVILRLDHEGPGERKKSSPSSPDFWRPGFWSMRSSIRSRCPSERLNPRFSPFPPRERSTSRGSAG